MICILHPKNFIIKNLRKRNRELKRGKLNLRVIISKGLVTKGEILTEVELLKKEMDEKIRKMGREN